MRVTMRLVVLFVWLPLLAANEKPAAQSPELKVLTPREGTWEIAFVCNPGQSPPVVEHRTETTTSEWILDGQFLLETTQSQDHTIQLFYGYDKGHKVYRRWSFDNRGATSDWSGTWDAESKAMTWKPTDGSFDAVVTERFMSDDHYKVTIVMKNKDGQLPIHIESDLRRIKK